MSDTSSVTGQSITLAVSNQIKSYLAAGDLVLPQDYSAENALKSAMLALPGITDKTGTPVTKACSKESIQNSLLSMCMQGLNPDKKQCYFIAYGSKLTMQRSHYGDIQVAKQVDPSIDDIYAAVVFEGDEFTYQIKRGKIVDINHGQQLSNKNKNIVGAYCTVVRKDGSETSTVMTIEQIKTSWEKSPTKPVQKDGSISPDSTHGKFPEEMAKKTIVHRTCKEIINNSNDSNLMVKYAKRSSDEADAIEVEVEIEENANTEILDAEFADDEPVEIKDPF